MYRERIVQTNEYARLKAAIATPGAAALFGLPAVGRAMVYAALALENHRQLAVVTSGEAEATRMAADLSTLGLRAAVLPGRDLVLRPIEGAGRETEYRRLRVLGELVGGRLDAVCLSVESLLLSTVPKEEFCQSTLTLKPGMEIGQQALLEALFRAGYNRRPQVDGPGQFSVRGGILDLYAPDMAAPARIEFWGDEIDTIHSFDLVSQRRDAALEKIYLSPAREVLFGDPAQAAALLRSALAKEKGARARRLEQAMEQDLALLDGGAIPVSMDKYIMLRYGRAATVLEYLENPILCLEEPGAIREAAHGAAFRRGEETKALLEEGVLAAGLEGYYLEESWLTAQVAKMPSIVSENFARSLPDIFLKDLVNAAAHPLPPWPGELGALTEDLKPMTAGKYAVTVLTGTPRAAEALCRDLAKAGFSATTNADTPPAEGLVQVLPGMLSAGVELPFARYAVITSRRAAAFEGKKKPARKKNKGLASLSDIKPGDYVVHQDHGIGVYAGIRRLDLQGVVKDYLQISYAKGDTLYVPVTQLDLLARYTAPGDGEKVKLSKLGGGEWVKTKSRVKKATQEMAHELIALYAHRKQAQGYDYPEHGDLQRDFDTRFEYDETPDQLAATAEIKQDMERPHPMDRLLCGDVGVGKTEVALRAAFKCVMGGKQCAILAPTTLLAWQHYNTILSRMEAFPLKVGLLSRMRSAAQQRETIKGLRAGVVDIVVGTHRLLQKDVKFKDLGLVIVDEEQRFGVKHKEQLKENFLGVDMLTLSATPIPRTLNMAMSGIRDMSTIEEPPIERQPIETYVLEYDERLVADAIKKELARGGQVYYLHNRIDTLEAVSARLQRLVPGLRVGIAHGRMTEEQLSAVWEQLLGGEIDLLACTTLIETGVDVRNCNTLIIEDADRMGLAQLYQIRGRVGRSGRKAYAYFTFQRDKVLTDIAAKRLSALREFTSFGSGFRIAMRDLQIRGAGSLLGKSQHGHMEAVGYDLYIKLLNQAIAAEKGEAPPPDKSECLIDITVDAYIPDRYIPDASGRIEAYKRIAAIGSKEDASDVLDELIDRYGDPPAAVEGLVDISLARVTAARLGIYEINQQQSNLRLFSDTLAPGAARRLLETMAGRVLYNGGAKPYLAVSVRTGEKPLDILVMALDALQEGAQEEENR